MDKWLQAWQKAAPNLTGAYPLPASNQLQLAYKSLHLKRFWMESLMIFAMQYGGIILSFMLMPVFPLWLASGSAAVMIFLRGVRILPALWLGSFCAYYFIYAAPGSAILFASIFALQAYLLLAISYRYISPTLLFSSKKPFVIFILLVMIVTALSSLGLTYITHFNGLQLWLAQLIGILIFAFAPVAWDAYFPQSQGLNNKDKRVLGACFIALAGLTIIMLLSHLMLTVILSLVISMGIIWIGRYYGWCAVTSLWFFFGVCWIFGALLNPPLLMRLSSLELIVLQAVFAVEMMLCLGATVF
ncbi:MAG: hypothetical protein QM752_08260 [Gammaproteobacteria bacterium]